MIACLGLGFLVLAILTSVARNYDAAMVWAVLFLGCVIDNKRISK